MSYPLILLGLLAEQPRYGYELKQTIEEEEERHGIGTQLEVGAGGVRKTVGGELGHVPHRVPGQGVRAATHRHN